MRAYKGIPYAAPPVCALALAPTPAGPALRACAPVAAFGPNSLQGVVFDDIDPCPAGVSEDCLYLNIWTPAAPDDGARLPTMVWIYGGGFVVGSGAEPRYDGAHLAARGILVVTLNHRLNALGFLAHPELTQELEHRASGNYGMLDLVAALEWVKRNIAALRRRSRQDHDRRRIRRLGGRSSALMASPLAKGLIARVIGESGAMFASPSPCACAVRQAEVAGLDFMRKVGAKTLAELRAASRRSHSRRRAGIGYRPIVDGWFLPAPARRNLRRRRAERRAAHGRLEQG